MNRRNDKSAAFTLLVAFAFMGYVLTLLLKYILYEHGSLSSNILLLVSILCARYYLCTTNNSLRTHEKVCLVLFTIYDKELLDYFNLFLLLGVACIREQLHQSSPIKELVTFGCGLIFLLMGWFSVGRILIIYNFSVILAFVLLTTILTIKSTTYYFNHLQSNDYAYN